MKRTLSLILSAAMLLLTGCVQVAETGNVVPYEAAYTDPVSTPVPEGTTAPTPIGVPEETPGALIGVDAESSAAPLPPATPAATEETDPSPTPPAEPLPTPTPSPTPSPTPAYTVEEMEEKEAYLNAGSANLREGPDTEYAILEELFENEKLTVTGKSGDWYRVETEDRETGFILAEFVEFGTAPTPKPTPSYKVKEMDDTAAYVNAGSANLRKGPGKDYDIIAELDRNEKITVTGSSGDWYRVEYGGKKGFITKELVKIGTVPTPSPSPTPAPMPSATPAASASPSPSVKPTATVSPTKKPESIGTSSGGNGYGVDPYDYFSDGGGFTAAELLLLAQVVQEEAKGTSVEARAAVANTIYNRYLSSNYPNDIEDIIFQKNQYTVADDEAEIRSVKPVADTVAAVKQIFVNHDTFLPEDVHFFRQKSRGTSWGDKRVYYATYGNNAFFRSLYGEYAR